MSDEPLVDLATFLSPSTLDVSGHDGPSIGRKRHRSRGRPTRSAEPGSSPSRLQPVPTCGSTISNTSPPGECRTIEGDARSGSAGTSVRGSGHRRSGEVSEDEPGDAPPRSPTLRRAGGRKSRWPGLRQPDAPQRPRAAAAAGTTGRSAPRTSEAHVAVRPVDEQDRAQVGKLARADGPGGRQPRPHGRQSRPARAKAGDRTVDRERDRLFRVVAFVRLSFEDIPNR